MTTVDTSCPEAAYLTKGNIVHPMSAFPALAAGVIATAEAKARLAMADRNGGVAVTGGSIKKGAN